MWLATHWGAPAPWPLIIWDLVELTGWTLEYVEALPMARLIEYGQIQRGRANTAKPEGEV